MENRVFLYLLLSGDYRPMCALVSSFINWGKNLGLRKINEMIIGQHLWEIFYLISVISGAPVLLQYIGRKCLCDMF